MKHKLESIDVSIYLYEGKFENTARVQFNGKDINIYGDNIEEVFDKVKKEVIKLEAD